MKRFLIPALLLLAGCIPAVAAILLEGVSRPLQLLVVCVMVLYLTGVLDWYTFFSRSLRTAKRTKIAVGIFSALLFIAVWFVLLAIVWEQR
ncbi:MAG: hypothetical protein HPZ91_07770 [Lentisphaeria bacterium]|nr:hypothetical protein [Lentisphaeria bacterium]